MYFLRNQVSYVSETFDFGVSVVAPVPLGVHFSAVGTQGDVAVFAQAVVGDEFVRVRFTRNFQRGILRLRTHVTVGTVVLKLRVLCALHLLLHYYLY